MSQLTEPARPAKQRARDARDKLARREQILEAALRVFDERPYAEIKMAEVARAAGLAKGTPYLYFASKEELFLELVIAELNNWFSDVGMRLGERGNDPDAIAGLIASSLASRPRVARFLSLLHSVLEHNIDTEAALRFKRHATALIEVGSAALEAQLPTMTRERGRSFLLHLHALVVGLAQMTSPAPAVARAIEENDDLAIFRLDFEAELAKTAAALLRRAVSP